MRTRMLALLGLAIVLASCGEGPSPSSSPSQTALPSGSQPTASASATPTPSVTAAATPASMPPVVGSPTPTAVPTLPPAPTAAGRWEGEPQLAVARGDPHAVLLGDGRVLVVGNDEAYESCVRPDSVESETFDPARRAWTDGPALNAPRAQFAAVSVTGGALVTGGVTAGAPDESGYAANHQSISSTYTFDPATAPAAWARRGLLDRARTLPIAATLRDGRVLVAGGYYLSGREEGSVGAPGGITLAAWPGRDAPGGGAGPFGDISPPTPVPALATAEVFDPATGRWSGTGALRLARIDAPVVTLEDGRVLVAGSTPVSGWNYTEPRVDARAYRTAEVYDPATGRFRLTGEYPEPDWTLLARWGPYPISRTEAGSPGALVPLDDGGALLVGQEINWSIFPLELQGSVTRTLRYEPASNAWTVIDQVVEAHPYVEQPTPTEIVVPGRTRPGAAAVRLADGRVLIAGGRDPAVVGEDGHPLTDAADLYDPAADTWYAVAPMPEERAGGAAVLLRDGSVLLVGGTGPGPTCFNQAEEGCDACGSALTGTSSVVRFIPGR